MCNHAKVSVSSCYVLKELHMCNHAKVSVSSCFALKGVAYV